MTGTRISVGMPTTEPTDESRNVFAVAFETDEAWDGLTLTAIFETDKSSAGYLMASDNIAPIPPSILSAKCKFFSVGLRGTDGDGNVLSSQMVNVYPVKRGAPLYDGSEDVDPTLYDQFAAKINDIQNIAEDAKKLASKSGYYTPFVDPGTGLLSWEPSNIGMDEAPSVNVMGPVGPKGDTGPRGPIGETGPRGISGVYIGAGDMPEGYNVQIDPSGSGDEIVGGYYTPEITQPDENTMRVSYAASQDGMEDVQDVDVVLPAGPQGDTGPAGYTPIKGVDYYTDAERAELIGEAQSYAEAAATAAEQAKEAAERAESAASGWNLEIGNGLKFDPYGKLEVDTADTAEQDNTRPITSAAVYVEVGNIGAILKTI